jgi:DNA polymerase zeta
VLAHLPSATVNRYTLKLTHSLNYALCVSLKRNLTSRSSQFVRAIVLVKGVHFYGFHYSYSPFLKVYLVDPMFINRAVTILRSTTVMGTRFRIFESHISYPLQFMCDFGLYGCGWLDLREIWERGIETSSSSHGSNSSTSPHYKQSSLPLEVDTISYHILNRLSLSARNWHHQLSIPSSISYEEPLVQSVRELWEDDRRRREANGLGPSPHMPKAPSDGSRGPGGGWASEARWWDAIARRIEQDEGYEPKEQSQVWENYAMSTFESVQALWERPWRTWKPGAGNHFEPAVVDSSDIQEAKVDVDETMLSSQDLGDLERDEGLRRNLAGRNWPVRRYWVPRPRRRPRTREWTFGGLSVSVGGGCLGRRYVRKVNHPSSLSTTTDRFVALTMCLIHFLNRKAARTTRSNRYGIV